MHKVLCCAFAFRLKVPHKCDNRDKDLNVKIYSYIWMLLFLWQMVKLLLWHPSRFWWCSWAHLVNIEFMALYWCFYMELTHPPAQFIFPVFSLFCPCNICFYHNLHALTVHIFLPVFVSSADIAVLKGQNSSPALPLFHEINRTDLHCLNTVF